jgi:hypothetical protein
MQILTSFLQEIQLVLAEAPRLLAYKARFDVYPYPDGATHCLRKYEFKKIINLDPSHLPEEYARPRFTDLMNYTWEVMSCKQDNDLANYQLMSQNCETISNEAPDGE